MLIRDATPLRLHDMSEDPRSVGFPPGHPPMGSFLGVPIMLRGHAFGNLYLTEKEEGDFTDQDQEVVELLASQAAVAIENARLYDTARRWTRQLDSLNELGTALVTELDLDRLLEVVADRLRELLGARVVLIDLRLPDGSLRVEGASGEGAGRLVGTLSPAGSKSHHVLRRMRSERVDSALEDPEIHPEGEAQMLDVQAGLWVPLVVRGEAIGVIAAADKVGRDPRFSDEDLRLAEAFGSRAAGAVELTGRVSRDTVRSMLQAQELERSRLSRDLHDQTGQALAALLLGLNAARRAETLEDRPVVARGPGRTRSEALADVRSIAVRLRPAALDELGLGAALERLASTSATASDGDLGDDDAERRAPAPGRDRNGRLPDRAGGGGKRRAPRRSRAGRRDGRDPAGRGDRDHRGQRTRVRPAAVAAGRLGLAGMRERAGLFNGRLQIESTPGAGPRSRPSSRSSRSPPPPVPRFPRCRATPARQAELVHPDPASQPDQTTTVLVVDDHPAVRTALCRLLQAQPGVQRGRRGGDVGEAAAIVEALHPAVTLLDLSMPGEGGLDALPRLKHLHPDGRVVMYSLHDEPAYQRAALSEGADGYVSRMTPTVFSTPSPPEPPEQRERPPLGTDRRPLARLVVAAHDHDRAGRVLGALVADRPEQELLEPPEAA